MKRSNKFPRGWNTARVARVLAHYEEQTEDAAVARQVPLRHAAGLESVKPRGPGGAASR